VEADILSLHHHFVLDLKLCRPARLLIYWLLYVFSDIDQSFIHCLLKHIFHHVFISSKLLEIRLNFLLFCFRWYYLLSSLWHFFFLLHLLQIRRRWNWLLWDNNFCHIDLAHYLWKQVVIVVFFWSRTSLLSAKSLCFLSFKHVDNWLHINEVFHICFKIILVLWCNYGITVGELVLRALHRVVLGKQDQVSNSARLFNLIAKYQLKKDEIFFFLFPHYAYVFERQIKLLASTDSTSRLFIFSLMNDLKISLEH